MATSISGTVSTVAVYLNPHQLFRYPSTIWRFAQDLLDVLPPSVVEATEIVVGPVTGGALLAHTMAGLLDSRRPITRPPTLFAPLTHDANDHTLSRFYAKQVAGKQALVVDDVRNTGQTQARCAELVRRAGGTVIATAEIYDRMEAMVDAVYRMSLSRSTRRPTTTRPMRARSAGPAHPSRRSEHGQRGRIETATVHDVPLLLSSSGHSPNTSGCRTTSWPPRRAFAIRCSGRPCAEAAIAHVDVRLSDSLCGSRTTRRFSRSRVSISRISSYCPTGVAVASARRSCVTLHGSH